MRDSHPSNYMGKSLGHMYPQADQQPLPLLSHYRYAMPMGPHPAGAGDMKVQGRQQILQQPPEHHMPNPNSITITPTSQTPNSLQQRTQTMNGLQQEHQKMKQAHEFQQMTNAYTIAANNAKHNMRGDFSLPSANPAATKMNSGSLLTPSATLSLPHQQMSYIPKHWLWNSNLFYNSNRSASDPGLPHSYFPSYSSAFGGGFNLNPNEFNRSKVSQSQCSSSPIQIHEVDGNSDDSMDNEITKVSVEVRKYNFHDTNILILSIHRLKTRHHQQIPTTLRNGTRTPSRNSLKNQRKD